jgi:putative transposase
MYQLITQQVEQHSGLAISRMCQALSLSRSDYYRWRQTVKPLDPDLKLRDQIQRIVLEMPGYGYRRVTQELERRSLPANHKRVLRLMRQDNLLCLRQGGFIRTTDSNHAWLIYPNLVPELILRTMDQLWVADITYIRLLREFIYLAVVLDAYSRRCIGWALDRTLEADLAMAALQMALRSRKVQPGLVHHSDRGVQYASAHYTGLLQAHGIRISMSRRGNPYDNAKAESFIKTLKMEEVYLSEYENLAQARRGLSYFLDSVYNHKRLHSALGYLPPAEFEHSLTTLQPA